MKFVLLALTFFCSVNLAAQSLENDRLALISLYNSTNGNEWTNKTGWIVPGSTGDNPCGWYGITCSDNRVTSIDMQNNNIHGNLPGQLGTITSLKRLVLGNNQLTGSIPTELGNLSELEFIFLYSNRLSGVIPYQLGNLNKLIYLILSENQLSGFIPTQLGNLAQLQQLVLNTNQLYGDIPPSIGKLSQLTVLSLGTNLLTGAIPFQLGELSKLEFLSLEVNQLNGSIPPQLGNLVLLHNLFLMDNLLSGSIPKELSQLSKLEYLNVSNNRLTGSIPSSIGNMQKLLNLDLSNNWLSGTIPVELGNLSDLISLFLRYNQLTGSIPSSLGNLSNIQQWNLEENLLSGTIPDLTNIQDSAYIVFGHNHFNFNGLESNISKIDAYANQGKIPIQLDGSTLTVNAGGLLANNTYRWYKNDILVANISGNNTYSINDAGTYRAEVTNSIATQLTLISENYVQSTPLPVTLVNFTAKHSPEGNLLQWSTTSETNNAGFEIERSNNAKSFEKIGFTDGKGESGSLHSYQFIDQNPFPVSYYRLKQLDYDGTSAYSHIIRVRSEVAALKVYPNPVKGQVSIESNLENETVQIYDLKGIQILKKSVLPLQTISTINWQTGTYLIRVGDKTQKIFVEN